MFLLSNIYLPLCHYSNRVIQLLVATVKNIGTGNSPTQKRRTYNVPLTHCRFLFLKQYATIKFSLWLMRNYPQGLVAMPLYLNKATLPIKGVWVTLNTGKKITKASHYKKSKTLMNRFGWVHFPLFASRFPIPNGTGCFGSLNVNSFKGKGLHLFYLLKPSSLRFGYID
ncbi:hypothetical protein UFOVP916_21 [uncultured Caudovirales phage]|uniref:Uncharacterized protein n=1 Tax=uncultured Caudovirales phage TaxID=2100421 RepID=A0A6J5RZU8_9CAUD|nr:hypothetical protein UFOVP827_42 [uncultured Caudovirales phage]CAB4171449.1 hypothetical protein UFOVP916_21 [uncultured Caudovirales phage]CAB4177423.1 hypothetical protein UFOVP1001_45 [uncultured Caudovirales phage]CAB4199268.1 hypothetical protein UFOVP1338_31 [uncultured Caudovirales phage]CAB4213418.1 hypothetical protein UFOVP1447_26 [uncultured Caudovirales phage]